MNGKKPLIVGIDPGTTTGYAVLDIEGNLLYVNSSKHLDLNQLISKTISFGKAVLVGTDKAKAPGMVEAFATKLGAKVISPEEDLKVIDKKEITKNFSFSDEHQGDALASALFAYRSARALLDKIDAFARENKRQDIVNGIKQIVIAKGVSIRGAVSILDKKEEEDKVMERVIVERKLSENDFLKLHKKLKKYETDIRLVRNYNNSLRNKIRLLEKNSVKYNSKEPENSDKRLDFADKRIKALEGRIISKNKDAEQLKSLIIKFNHILSDIGNFYVLKKLDNLGANEFSFKNKILNIRRNDILLVGDPNISSSSTIELLRNKVFVIVHKKPVSKKVEGAMPFVFIDSKNLEIDEDRYFGFVGRRQLDAEKGKSDWIGKIVEDYKKEKGQLISL
ncbi:DUF460 domain-containing protein [Candidatus Woesearchaeota archaeon]|nr:DUF460 domain-containing protein [Candidatus Woesearchaeota archaeon]